MAETRETECVAGPRGCDPQGGEMVTCEVCDQPACDFHGDYDPDGWVCHVCQPPVNV
jgi:hypothetical protein